MAVHQRLPSNLMELEKCCKKFPKDRCAKPLALYSKRLEAADVAKMHQQRFEQKAVNTYAHVIFFFFCHAYIFNLFPKKKITLSLWGMQSFVGKKCNQSIMEYGYNITKCGKSEAL